MVFGDDIQVDKAYGVDDTEDIEKNIMIISRMITLILISGEIFGDDNGNIDNKNNNTDYANIYTRRA